MQVLLSRAQVQVGEQPVPWFELGAVLERCSQWKTRMPWSECLSSEHVRDLLLNREATERGLSEGERLARKRAEILAEVWMQEQGRAAPEPTEQELEEERAKQQRELSKPERFRIFRILFAEKEKAEQLLAEWKGEVSLEEFRSAARTHSVDSATNQRGGDLGYVHPDGSTDVPEVSADPAVYAAVQELQDGELAPTVVQEGKYFAVVWRRGSLPRTELHPEQADPWLKRSVQRQKTEERIQSFLQEARERSVQNYRPELIEQLKGRVLP